MPFSACARDSTVAACTASGVITTAAATSGRKGRNRNRVMRRSVYPPLLKNGCLAIGAPDFPQGVAYLPECGVGFHRLQDKREAVLPGLQPALKVLERLAYRLVVPAGAQALQTRGLALLILGADLENFDLLPGRLFRKSVQTDENALPGVELFLELIGRVGDLLHEEALFDAGENPAYLLDSAEVVVGPLLHPVGQPFDVIGAGQRIDDVRH